MQVMGLGTPNTLQLEKTELLLEENPLPQE
jgi:hypothetical protein